MRVGLIGLGMVADTHVAALRAAGLDLAWAMGRDPGRAAAFAARHATRAVPAPEAADFVIVATPPDARDMVPDLAARGMPILAEKPLERDHARAAAQVAACEAAGVPFGVVLQHRTRPAAAILARRLPELGRLATVELRAPYWRAPDYYAEPGRGSYDRDGGGVLITQAIHPIDLMLTLTGPVESVRALLATARHDLEAEDFAAAALRFRSGAVGSLMASTTHYPGGDPVLVLNGTEGSAVLEGDRLALHGPGGTERIEAGAGDGSGGGADPMAFSHARHQAVIEGFAEALRAGRAPPIPARDALGVQALIDALAEAGRTGREVAVRG